MESYYEHNYNDIRAIIVIHINLVKYQNHNANINNSRIYRRMFEN